MRVYISGPMTGLPNNNTPEFNQAADQLRAAGHQPINPAEVGDEAASWTTEPTWHDCMAAAVWAMEQAQAICYLPGHQASPGARIEAIIAERMRLPVIDLPSLVPA
jgi:hypothetical protein